MKFCMITTFFGPHSFGGDAAFVDRLSRALGRRGHDVHVIYCEDAYNICRGDHQPRPYRKPPGVTIHALQSRFGPLSPLLTQQTGRPWFKRAKIEKIVREISPDVIHFHNLSLIGGPGLLLMPRPTPKTVKLLTTHEHWLVCPLSVLWKYDGRLCERPQCFRCSLKSGRPPQLWRTGTLREQGLDDLDALICPSVSTQTEHAKRGVTRETVHLPYFLPTDYLGTPATPTPQFDRPYLVAAGRLEDYKGFQDAVAAMRSLPQWDLRIAGTGTYESALKQQAEGMSNVHFHGPLDSPHLAALTRGAVAVVVPSLVYETFGYVVLEAFAERTPVIVRELGALPELVEESQGGLTFDSPASLIHAMDRIARDRELRDALGNNGYRAWKSIWSEDMHIARYTDIIQEAGRQRTPETPDASTPRAARSTSKRVTVPLLHAIQDYRKTPEHRHESRLGS